MANQTVLLINYTAASIDNYHSTDDLPPYSAQVVTVTDAELTALTTAGGVLVMKSTATDAEKRLASKILRLGKNPGYATS